MQVNIIRNKIFKQEENKVTSGAIKLPHVRKDPNNVKFDPNGIFSKRIFGNFYRCDCGELKEPGYCPICETRVIDKSDIPEFYIDLPCLVPIFFYDVESLNEESKKNNIRINIELVEEVIKYNAFLYIDSETNESKYYIYSEGKFLLYSDYKLAKKLSKKRNKTEYNNLQLKSFPSDYFKNGEIIYGKDLLYKMNVSKSWIEENMDDYILIPHTSYRPLIMTDSGNLLTTSINEYYSKLIIEINKILEMDEFLCGPLYFMQSYRMIVKLYNTIIQNLLNELQNQKYNIIRSEIISHPISGAIRAALINRHDLNEDIILIGDTEVQTLYPYLFEKYKGNMIEINKALIDNNEIVLFNRPPTIAHLSIIAMKPRIASVYPYGEIEGTNGGLLHNEIYCKKNGDKIGIFNDEVGDVERFYKGFEDGIDTIGLRTIAVNPICLDGLAGDFDGDVLLVVALYSEAAKRQAEKLLPSRSYINFANGTIRNHIIEDFLYCLEDEE